VTQGRVALWSLLFSIGTHGAHGWTREWPERALCDVSAHLRFGCYQVKSGRGVDIAFL
jgi:hypothetical protein